ncbi:alpha/beta fold hydrolase [Leptospira sarikeiensis]|uniref:Alpha/beta hydrolase n=1 Tax=Leptospira sarikeiensis TaxID=2484943 RepID=A0A4R9K3J7_9LEPT|nr:alpha/beta hydrolase [Leptospira sarikeiensis]TGL60616.1 alpha/beta hydrolase [Leptospira sarikeiensis]
MITLATSVFGIVLCKGEIIKTSVHGPTGKISYKDEGFGGMPVVFVHSFGGNVSHWDGIKDSLVQNRRVVRIELRGHGDSEFPKDGDYRISSMAKDLATVVNLLGLQRFVLVGHSMGGSVALQYAGENPSRVAGLVLVDSNGDPKKNPEEIRTQIKNVLFSDAYVETTETYWKQLLERSKPEVQERLFEELVRAPKDMVIKITSELLDYDPTLSLKRYVGPKLAIVTPENDDKFSLHRLQLGFPHKVIQNAGHWLQLDQPEAFREILETFLQRY